VGGWPLEPGSMGAAGPWYLVNARIVSPRRAFGSLLGVLWEGKGSRGGLRGPCGVLGDSRGVPGGCLGPWWGLSGAVVHAGPRWWVRADGQHEQCELISVSDVSNAILI
jgi:hypothetical protein